MVVNQGNSAGLTLRERIPIGTTYYNGDEIDEIIEYYGEFWHGRDYDPFGKNCNAFSAKLIEHICDGEGFYCPPYVNRFSKLGSIFRMWFKPLQQLVGDLVKYDNTHQS